MEFAPRSTGRSADLSADRRLRSLERLRERADIDIVVVGGGITGAGVALDAAARGLSVVLVERHDLAHGTSRWSSKLVHGGLRYLAHGEVDIAWESAVERDRLMRTIAPHLIRPMRQVLPTPRGSSGLLPRVGAIAGEGLKLGASRGRPVLPRARRLSAADVHHLVPAVDPSAVDGGTLMWEGQLEDDARLVVAVARTAAAYGAHILTRVECLHTAEGEVHLLDTLTGESLALRASGVVIATGAWVGDLDPAVAIAPARGTHLVVRSERLGHPSGALTVGIPGDHSRYVFALPQPDGLTYVGITDEPDTLPICDEPRASKAEVDWICEHISSVLDVPLGAADVVGAFTGIRPLVQPGGGASTGEAIQATADLSRRHLVRRMDRRTVSVTGGKLTTYRRMAEDALDLLTERPCRTHHLPLVGAHPGLPRGTEARGDVPVRLRRRYGAEAARVWGYAAAEPELAEPVAQGVAVLGVELLHGLVAEGALTVDDLLHRRTRIGLVPADLAASLPAAQRIWERWR